MHKDQSVPLNFELSCNEQTLDLKNFYKSDFNGFIFFITQKVLFSRKNARNQVNIGSKGQSSKQREVAGFGLTIGVPIFGLDPKISRKNDVG